MITLQTSKDVTIRLGDPGLTSPRVQPLPPPEGTVAGAALVDIDLSEDVGKEEKEGEREGEWKQRQEDTESRGWLKLRHIRFG